MRWPESGFRVCLEAAAPWKTSGVGFKPRSRREACRYEVCVELGYCGGDTRWSDESDFDGVTPDEVVDSVLIVEGIDPTTADPHRREQIKGVVVDWLFDPHGRGRRSGLPR